MRTPTLPRLLFSVLLCLPFFFAAQPARGEDRFPRPEFESGYVRPERVTPAPRLPWRDTADITLLAAGLGITAWLALKRRSRKGLLLTALAGASYFGFVRGGCVCSVGSIQNVAHALGSGAALPVAVTAFFLLPLIAALFWGRVFCAGVCPLGAIQELVLLRPLRVPPLLDRAGRAVPWLILFPVVVCAATGTTYLLCSYDPFISLYRLTGSLTTLLAGGGVLLVAMFIGRPFCRWLCPYGALLGLCSRAAETKLRITPGRCTNCRMCEDACPYGAILPPATNVFTQQEKKTERIILAALLCLLPLLALAGYAIGGAFSRQMIAAHPDVALADILDRNSPPLTLTEQQTQRLDGLRLSKRPPEDVRMSAAGVILTGRRVGQAAGAFLGVLLGLSLIGLTCRRAREEHQPHPSWCVRCGRCWRACPHEQALKREEAGRG